MTFLNRLDSVLLRYDFIYKYINHRLSVFLQSYFVSFIYIMLFYIPISHINL